VAKAHRVLDRAIQAILEYTPRSAAEALQLLEFVSAEDAFRDELSTVIENATVVLRGQLTGIYLACPWRPLPMMERPT
jgi:hypothetical protein